jgi:hypothetical protein
MPYGMDVKLRDRIGCSGKFEIVDNAVVRKIVAWLRQDWTQHPTLLVRKLVWLVVLLGLASAGVSLLIEQVAAAIELDYFIVVPTQRDITLQWATVAEYDLSGFEVLCKREDELDNAYHVIGDVPAEGGPQEGATYLFPITSGLERGVTYCFRLREVPINGEPGDIFDQCGYGLGIVPTPTIQIPLTDTAALRATESALAITSTLVAANQLATAVAAAEATVNALRATAAITATPTLTGAAQLAPTLTAISQISPTLTAFAVLNSAPTFTPTPGGVITDPFAIATQTAVSLEQAATQTAIALQGGGVLPGTPTFTPTPTFDFTNQQPFSITQTIQSAQATETTLAFQSSALTNQTPTFTVTPIGNSPLPQPGLDPVTGRPLDPNTGLPWDPTTGQLYDPTTGQPLPGNQTFTPTPDPNLAATPTPTTPVPQSAALPEGGTAIAANNTAENTPDPVYTLLTATPMGSTSPPPPTLTPLPTATATLAGVNLANLMAPTTQNLTLMLLCFTFFTASGLGILGLITSVIYMRSQRDREDRLP